MGLRHQQHRLHASAHNTANAGVDQAEAVRLRTGGVERENGGVQAPGSTITRWRALG